MIAALPHKPLMILMTCFSRTVLLQPDCAPSNCADPAISTDDADISAVIPEDMSQEILPNSEEKDIFHPVRRAIDWAVRIGTLLTPAQVESLIRKAMDSSTQTSLENEKVSSAILQWDEPEQPSEDVVVQELTDKIISEQQSLVDRLAIIQRVTLALLQSKSEDPHYNLPRFFVVLPENEANGDSSRFRLHFICDGNDPEVSTSDKDIKRFHRTPHGGFLVRDPKRFFRQYGPFLLLMLETLRTSIVNSGDITETGEHPRLAAISNFHQGAPPPRLTIAEKASFALIKQTLGGIEQSLLYLTEEHRRLYEDDQSTERADILTDLKGLVTYLEGVEEPSKREIVKYRGKLSK